MDTKELKKIEMKEDGKDLDRFQTLLKTVVTTPKADIQKKRSIQKRVQRKPINS